MTTKNNKTVSKFNFKVYLVPITILLFWSYPIIASSLNTDKNYGIFERIISLSILPLIVIIISFYQLRQNLLKIIITEESITFRRYLGFGKNNVYNLNDFDGFYVQIKKAKEKEYEILKIVKDNKTLMNISQFYIDNYSDLKLKLGLQLRLINIS
jgi:hypothetical protein